MEELQYNEYINIYEKQLFESVLPFWLKYSKDNEYGGYLDCLSDDGVCYDTNKHIWLQGRQLWMLCTLLYDNDHGYNNHHINEKKDEILELAKCGAIFIKKYAFIDKYKRCYFQVTRDGQGCGIQRKIFSECFVAMGFIAYSNVSGEKEYLTIALQLYDSICNMIDNPNILGRPSFNNIPIEEPLNIPMILLNIIDEFRKYLPKLDDKKENEELFESKRANWCIEMILKHQHPEKNIFMEYIYTNSDENSKYENNANARLFNPGHSIECSWFLMNHNNNDERLLRIAEVSVNSAYEIGWDTEFGGLYSFVDILGFSPVQLEYDKKLWWPHTEILIALLMLYQYTRSYKYFDLFKEITSYSLNVFGKTKEGGWFGYANRANKITHKQIGAPYKGFFHVPRSLFYIIKILYDLKKNK